MKENKELQMCDLSVDSYLDVDSDTGHEITAYLETWFDVDKKFGTNVNANDDEWLNMYAKYDPFKDTLRIEYEISSNDGSSYFDYEPTASEAQLIKDMITKKCQVVYGQTPQEFCNDICGDGPQMGGIT